MFDIVAWDMEGEGIYLDHGADAAVFGGCFVVALTS